MHTDDLITTGFVNKPIEFALTAERAYDDPFNQIEVDALFTDEAGTTWRVPAFWAGDNVFRVRFSAPQPGTYTWRTEASSVDDHGLHGRTGVLRARPYTGPSPLYRHGRVRTAASKRTLEHADGTPFLWLADTWWMGASPRLDWSDGFRRLTEDRVRKGFNTIQIVVGPLPDFCATSATWDPQQANEGGWPWEQDFARINPAFYDHLDVRLAFLVEQGLMPCLVGMWGYYLPFMGVDRVKQHWRYLVARYGAYPVTWCLAGECTMPTYARHGTPDHERDREAQAAGWTEVARYVRALDPWGTLQTVHPAYMVPARYSLKDPSLVDLDMLQTGHSGYGSLEDSVRAIREAVADTPVLPALNSEACYEGIMGGSKDEVQRFLFWASMLKGACGHTYGAQGIWAMSSRDELFQGTTGSWGDGVWQDVMHYLGSAHVGIGAEILRRYPWWRLEPSEGRVVGDEGEPDIRFVARIPGELIVAYLPCNCMPYAASYELSVDEEARYRAAFHNPRTGAVVPIGDVYPEEGRWRPPRKPTMEDWVLILETVQ